MRQVLCDVFVAMSWSVARNLGTCKMAGVLPECWVMAVEKMERRRAECSAPRGRGVGIIYPQMWRARQPRMTHFDRRKEL